MKFCDYFSKQSSAYVKFRPTYPDSLFKFITDLCSKKRAVLDLATGSGQAANSLINYFDSVYALDASKDQILNAIPNNKINYLIANAEFLPLKNKSVDLICVAQALHWFNINSFYLEAKRILTTGGIIVAWCYGLLTINNSLDKIINKFYHEVLHAYWPKERNHIDNKYKLIPFPFKAIDCPTFFISISRDLEFLLGYLETWSAVQKYKDANNKNPLEIISSQLRHEWGNPKTRIKIIWPIFIKAGKNSQ